MYFNLLGDVKAPNRAHADDAGIDFFVPNDKVNCFIQNPSKPYLFRLSDHSFYIKNNFKTEKRTCDPHCDCLLLGSL